MSRPVVIEVPRHGMVLRPTESQTTLKAELQRTLANIAQEAASLAGAAQLVAHSAEEALSEGGTVSIQSQLAFMVGALMRLTKDAGVIEHLQKHGAAVQRRALIRQAR